MLLLRNTFLPLFFFFIVLSLSGCFYNNMVRHLASDVSLVVPGQTTKQDVISYLDAPQLQFALPNNHEKWIYYQTKKSLLRKTPLVGTLLGYEKYDVVTIIFANDVAKSSEYRELSEADFTTKVVQANEAKIE